MPASGVKGMSNMFLPNSLPGASARQAFRRLLRETLISSNAKVAPAHQLTIRALPVTVPQRRSKAGVFAV